MPTYDTVPPEVAAITEEAVGAWHPEIGTAEVTFAYLFARASKPGQCAVKLHGYPCDATIKVNSAKDRAKGMADVTLEINGDTWDDKTYEERLALIDHEVTHLVVQRDKEGELKRDDQGRPKLKVRLHDYEYGGFREVARRHGEHSGEVQHAKHLAERFGEVLQLSWGWADEHKRSRGPRLAGVEHIEHATAAVG